MIAVFQMCPNLRKLSLGFQSVTLHYLQSLSTNCPLLEVLTLNNVRIPENIPNCIFPKLISFRQSSLGLCDL